MSELKLRQLTIPEVLEKAAPKLLEQSDNMAGLHPLDMTPYPEPVILRKKIVISFGNIIKHLSNIDVISDTLISQRVFSFDDSKRVTAEKTEEARAREMLYVLDKKPDHGVVAFMEALLEDNAHVHDMIIAADVDAKPFPVSETLAEEETLRVFLEACTSQCLCLDASGCLDVTSVTTYIQHQCTNSGLPHRVTNDDVIRIVTHKFNVTVHRPQMFHAPDQILGLSWKPEIRDQMEQVRAGGEHQVFPLKATDELDGDASNLLRVSISSVSSDVEAASVESDTIQLLAEQLHAIISRDVSTAIEFLGRMSQVDRTRVVTQLIGHKSALYKAFVVNSYNLMVYLIDECKIDVNQYIIASKTTARTTVLAQVALSNKLEMAKLLVKNGADINKANIKGSPLLPAVLSNISLNKVGCVNNHSDTIGMTAVMEACWAGHLEMVQFLVKSGADINLQDRNGRTCLMAAICKPDITSYILSLGGDVNAQDNDGDTALHWAVYQKTSDSVRLLLKNRAEVATSNSCKNTALHLAIIHNSVDIVNELLNHGADPYRRNKDKEDGLLLAVIKDRYEIVDILVKHHERNKPSDV